MRRKAERASCIGRLGGGAGSHEAGGRGASCIGRPWARIAALARGGDIVHRTAQGARRCARPCGWRGERGRALRCAGEGYRAGFCGGARASRGQYKGRKMCWRETAFLAFLLVGFGEGHGDHHGDDADEAYEVVGGKGGVEEKDARDGGHDRGKDEQKASEQGA